MKPNYITSPLHLSYLFKKITLELINNNQYLFMFHIDTTRIYTQFSKQIKFTFDRK